MSIHFCGYAILTNIYGWSQSVGGLIVLFLQAFLGLFCLSLAALQRLKPGKGYETEKQQILVKNNMVINYQQWLKEWLKTRDLIINNG